MHKSQADYDARRERIFGATKNEKGPARKRDAENDTSGVAPQQGARPTCEHAAGVDIFLTADQAVHGLLNLRSIRDPGRWLKRHGAPVALDTGHEKRFLAADVIRWAAEKFGPDESGRSTLAAIADSLAVTAAE